MLPLAEISNLRRDSVMNSFAFWKRSKTISVSWSCQCRSTPAIVFRFLVVSAPVPHQSLSEFKRKDFQWLLRQCYGHSHIRGNRPCPRQRINVEGSANVKQPALYHRGATNLKHKCETQHHQQNFSSVQCRFWNLRSDLLFLLCKYSALADRWDLANIKTWSEWKIQSTMLIFNGRKNI